MAGTTISYRTIPSAIFVKPYAVDLFNYLCERLAAGEIDEDTHCEMILERVSFTLIQFRLGFLNPFFAAARLERLGIARPHDTRLALFLFFRWHASLVLLFGLALLSQLFLSFEH